MSLWWCPTHRLTGPNACCGAAVRAVFTDDPLIRGLNKIANEPLGDPIAITLRRCTDGWLFSLARMVVLSLVLLTLTACKDPPHLCIEVVCKPTWSGNCVCDPGQRAVELPSGSVKCECPDLERKR